MRIRYYSRNLATWCRHLYVLRQSTHNRTPVGHIVSYQTVNRFISSPVQLCRFTKYTAIDRKRTSKEVDEFMIDSESIVNDNNEDFDNYDDHDEFDNDSFDDINHDIYTAIDKAVGRFSGEHFERISLKPNSPPDSKLLRVSIIGAPNAGKSTLINSLVGWKLNGVSSKVHTTEKNAFSVYSNGNTQIVFTDTPGVMTQMERVRHNNSIETMEAPAKSVLEADIIGVIVDIGVRYERKFRETVLQILHDNADKPSFLILNKIDMLKEDSVILTVTQKLTNGIVGGKEFGKARIISPKQLEKDPDAVLLTGEGFNNLLNHLEKKYGNFEYLDQIEFENSKEVGIETLVNKSKVDDITENKELKSEPTVKLEDDSFQREFLEEILNRSKNSSSDRNRDESEVKDDSLADPKSWITKIQEHKQKVRQSHWGKFEAVFPVSALTGAGIEYLMEFLNKNAMPGPWLYHSSVVTNQDPAEIAKMCVRQALLDHLGGSLPYNIEPEIVYWNVTENDRLDIVMDLVVRDSYEKGLLLGQGHMKPAFAAGLDQHEKRKLSQKIARLERFTTPVSLVTKVASDAKQALLDVFRCEMKFKLAVRQDSSVSRRKRRKTSHARKLIKRHI